jgi:hypothetical protein
VDSENCWLESLYQLTIPEASVSELVLLGSTVERREQSVQPGKQAESGVSVVVLVGVVADEH